ncbi:glycosyl hydrolase [Arcicella sp. DC2W]|uniref:Glycosyl hydrolase n=1 Tax=Arcicella gelida TaxID=2984195 RepID=A0ABU5S4F1_9BACT|nr:glycosyl hydrolase [Arcicella sp. DC2W]MEA5403320.1 glycosyl hydrolase [Arcicella sp. DC2W]
MKKIIIGILLIPSLTFAQNPELKDFQTPPNAAKPRVWWHWMNGNITKEGIKKDLEWFEKTGIGGFQNFDANLLTPVVVPKKLVFMTPEWKEAFKYTTELANEKGLEMAIAGSPGWSVTGGPWVKPEDAMKKYVWTETSVEGGKNISLNLPKPPDIAGKYQSSPYKSESFFSKYVGDKPVFYHDAMVIAFRLPQNDKSLADFTPKVSSSGGVFNFKNLTDGDLGNPTMLPPMAVGEDMWIQYEFDSPQTFKAASIAGAITRGSSDFNGVALNRSIKVSDDGINFKEIAAFTGSIVPFNTISFPSTTAKYWRIAYKTLPAPINVMAAMAGGNPKVEKPDGVEVSEFILHTTDRIDQVEDKAGFTPWREEYNIIKETQGVMQDVISTEDVIDLTNKMLPDGTLNWQAPAGSWKIIRFGYSLTGRQNHPASPEATGLEVDKLDKEAVRKYINTYLDMYKDATGGMMGEKGLQYMVLDSYEAGHMNWTKAFPEEFKKRRGYDMTIWVPVLIGRIVKNTEASEKFLWDFRKTIGEMIVENHYEVIGEELSKRGMKRYTESHENGRIFLADGMDVKRNADIPMSAMWTPGSLQSGGNEEVRSEADIRESASVANIYGKPIVAAESMTAIQNAFSWHPEKLKRTADLEMASGLNRFVIHTSVHQPLDDRKPGFSLGPFGQYFTRQETWAGAGAKAWMDYLGRSSYMLQQGKNVADILYYYGENTNITWICREKLPNIPTGFEFDFVNSSALLNAIQAKNGQLIAKSGNTYKVLILDESAKYMTLPVLKKIKLLADAGVKIIGTKPEKSPSLTDNESDFKKLADEIWSKTNVTVFNKINLKPDVIISSVKNKILYRHRQSSDQDIYWFNNRGEEPTNAEVSFKVSGKIPALWNPQTGKTEKVSYKVVDGRTIIPLKFESWDAYFIIFKGKTTTKSYTKIASKESLITPITSIWKASFNDKIIDFEKLISWSENPDADIKYFSGTATYENAFTLTNLDKSGNYIIDLGDVKHIAEVIINGKNVGTAWKKPFKLDISEAVRIGKNSIQIKVSNLWVNRLIGDAQPNAKKTTFTTIPFYRKDAQLLPSGLLAPIRIYFNK